MNNKPLSSLTIIDFSHRLPGPLAGLILSHLGAKVIKIEDHTFQDPFLSGLFAQFDPSFKNWYANLNEGKEIKRFDFKNVDDIKKIQDLVASADGLIMGLPPKTRLNLKLLPEDLKFNKPYVVIELLASRTEKKSMHDLNALAISGLLSQYVHSQTEKKDYIDPPSLPIAGISFGHKGATDFLASYIKSIKTQTTEFAETYLDEVTKEILGIFWPNEDRKNNRTKFLHNGQYPCYTLYKTKDNSYVALAAVEEKFWNKFCEIFKIETSIDRFHHTDNTLFDLISRKIKSYSLKEIESLIGEEDVCLSPVK